MTYRNTRSLFLGIWRHIRRKWRLRFACALLLMLASGVAEVLSLAAVVPFLAVLSTPERLWQSAPVRTIAIQFGFTAAEELLFPVTILFGMSALLAAIVRLVNIWYNCNLAAGFGSDISGEVYSRILHQPYSFHLQRTSSEAINTVLVKVGRTVEALKAALQFTTSSIVASAIFLALVLINWQVALSASFLFGIAYLLISLIILRRLQYNSQSISESTAQVLKVVQEGLGGIREVLLDGLQNFYVDRYLAHDRRQRRLQSQNELLIIFPRYSLEAIGVIAIAFMGLIIVNQQNSQGTVIPVLGALALGAQRLLPVLQQVYSGWALMKSYNADIIGILDILDKPLPEIAVKSRPLQFIDSIAFHKVFFCYGDAPPFVIRDLNLEIKRGNRIGLVGSTGSGKSTLIDLLMGLHVPTSGKLLVDGLDVNDQNYPERLAAWRASISHVPQSIYLGDCSIAENVAFGVPKHKIDLSLVKKACEQAQISKFIESTKHGYSTFVGERGVRLSGGQRQRIAIARALYKNASILVLDEATSALDNETEKAVMDAVDNLSRDLTVIMIAHRLTTVQNCDRVIRLSDGMITN